MFDGKTTLNILTIRNIITKFHGFTIVSAYNNSETQRIVQNVIGPNFGHITIMWLILFLVTRLNTKRDT